MAEALIIVESASDDDECQEEQTLTPSKTSKVRLAVWAGGAFAVLCSLVLLGMLLGNGVRPGRVTRIPGRVTRMVGEFTQLAGQHSQTCSNYPDQYDGYDEVKPFGASDKDGDRCKFYKDHVHECGNYDDLDFLAKEMCCVCGGGSTYQGKRSIAPSNASVFVSALTECPQGSEPITTISGCRAALDLLGWNAWDYNGASEEGDFPKGCYYCKDVSGCEDGVWFNSHASGGDVAGTKRLCHKNYNVEKVKILFVGDSDIDYWDSGTAFPGSMNVGVGGYTTKDVIKEVDTWVKELDPEWVVLVCGENDIEADARGKTNRAFERFKTIANKFIDDGSRVIVLGTKPEPDSKDLFKEYKHYDQQIRTWITGKAKGEEWPHIQMIDVFESFNSKKVIYNSDGLHMSRLGYKFWNGWVKLAMNSKVPCVRWMDGVCMEMPM